MYGIADGTTTPISASVDPDGNLDDIKPLIGNNKVVWTQTGLDSTETKHYIHDLTTGDTFQAPADFTLDFGPTRSGNLSITTKFDGQDREVFLHHLRLRKDEQITNNSTEEKQAAIDGNHLVWVEGQGLEQEIYIGITRSLILVSPGDGVTSQKKEYPVFMWEGIGYDRFRVQFSSSRDFMDNWTTIAFPLPDDAWLSQTSFTVKRWQALLLNLLSIRHHTLYWRILAHDEDGNEKISQVRSLVMASPKKNKGQGNMQLIKKIVTMTHNPHN